jgi:hypothetical protein
LSEISTLAKIDPHTQKTPRKKRKTPASVRLPGFFVTTVA